VFFLGNFDIFEPLKIQEQEFVVENLHDNFRFGRSYRSGEAETILLCDKMTNHLEQMSPTSNLQGLSFAAVTMSHTTANSGR
jgi:hypothetical protein